MKNKHNFYCYWVKIICNKMTLVIKTRKFFYKQKHLRTFSMNITCIYASKAWISNSNRFVIHFLFDFFFSLAQSHTHIHIYVSREIFNKSMCLQLAISLAIYLTKPKISKTKSKILQEFCIANDSLRGYYSCCCSWWHDSKSYVHIFIQFQFSFLIIRAFVSFLMTFE